MGWDSTNNVLTYPFTKIAANGQGDLQRALSTSSMSEYELVADKSVVNNAYVDANRINAMAKYKPFRSSTAVFASDSARNTARASARYGLAEPDYFYPNSYSAPPAWIYNKPRGVVANSYTEYLRAMDFVKDTTSGYDPAALPPVAMDLESTGGIKAAGTFGILLWKDSYVNTYATIISSTGHWWSDRSLSVQEILYGGSSSSHYNEYYIAFCFYVYNAAGTAITDVNLVTTNKKFGDISSVEIFMFYPQGDGTQSGDYIESGIHYPIIPLLQTNTYTGRQFLVAVCLTSTGPSDPTTYAYQVIPNNYSCISLGFDANRRYDYVITTANSTSAIDLLSGSFNSGPSLTLVQQHTGGWNEYSCSVWITADITSDATWTGTAATVAVQAYAPGGVFGALPDDPTSYGEFTDEVSVSVPSGAHTNTRQLVQLPNVFIYHDAPHSVVVSAKFTQSGSEKTFDNSLTITD